MLALSKVYFKKRQHRFLLPARQQNQAQPREMRLWCTLRHAPRIHSLPTRHRGQSRESLGHHKNGANPRCQGSAESDRMFGGAKSFYLKVGRKGVAAVSALEKSRAILLDLRSQGVTEPTKL